MFAKQVLKILLLAQLRDVTQILLERRESLVILGFQRFCDKGCRDNFLGGHTFGVEKAHFADQRVRTLVIGDDQLVWVLGANVVGGALFLSFFNRSRRGVLAGILSLEI